MLDKNTTQCCVIIWKHLFCAITMKLSQKQGKRLTIRFCFDSKSNFCSILADSPAWPLENTWLERSAGMCVLDYVDYHCMTCFVLNCCFLNKCMNRLHVCLFFQLFNCICSWRPIVCGLIWRFVKPWLHDIWVNEQPSPICLWR